MEIRFKDLRALRYVERARRLTRKGSYAEALDYYQLALDCTTEEFERAAIQYYISHALANSGRYEESRTYANLSLDGCDRAANRGTVTEELRQDIREVLDHISAVENKTRT